jgi:hypothetical protein
MYFLHLYKKYGYKKYPEQSKDSLKNLLERSDLYT